MEEKEKKESILAKIKKVKHIEIIIAVVAVIVMLLIYFSTLGGGGSKNSLLGGDKKTPAQTTTFYTDYCQRIQIELTQTISKIEGAGETKLIISWESSIEYIFASNENSSSSSSSKSPIVVGGNPIVTKEIYPKALGAVVVCKGGANSKVKVAIMMTISTLLEIPTEKILVYPM